MGDAEPSRDDRPASPALLSAFLRGRDVPCVSCGYNLRDVASDLCPECGLPLVLGLDGARDPNRALRPAVALGLAWLGLMSGVQVYVAIVLWSYARWRGVPWPSAIDGVELLASVLGLGVAALGLLRLLMTRGKALPRARAWLVVCWASLAAVLVWTVLSLVMPVFGLRML